jgi:hypothetical protein
MYYGKAGQLVRVDALYEKTQQKFFNTFHLQNPHIEAIKSFDKKFIRIEHDEIVLLLESSVAPWYDSDRLRCLWKDKEVFILRKALKIL